MRKTQFRRGLGAARVVVGEPIGDVKELAQTGRALGGRHGLAVNGGVAGVLDEPRLHRKRLPDQRLEARLGEMGGKRRLERVFQGAVMAKQPEHRGLQSEPRVKSRRARIGVRKIFRPLGVGEDVGKFGFEKGELRHRANLQAADARTSR